MIIMYYELKLYDEDAFREVIVALAEGMFYLCQGHDICY